MLEEISNRLESCFNCLCKCVLARPCACVRVKHLIVPAVFVLGGHYTYRLPWAQKVFFSFSLLALFLSGPTAQPSSLFPSTELLRVCSFTCSAFTDCKGNLLFVKSQQSQLCPSLRGEGTHHGPRAPVVVVEATSC